MNSKNNAETYSMCTARVLEISIVSPVYQAEEIVPHLVKEITVAVEAITHLYEIILVDDRSDDGSWTAIKKECKNNKKIKGLRLSRNFGQHSAITAGLKFTKGNWIIVMDCDLQDRPDQISTLYNEALKGFDIVYARRRARKDSKIKKIYSVFSYLTDTTQDATIANFGIYNKKVIDAVLCMNDNMRYFPAMVQWVGFRSTSVDVVHASRAQGNSTYSLGKMSRLAINNIISFSDKPLKLVAQAGLVLSGVSFAIGLLYFIGYLLGAIKIAGYASVIISIWLTAGINIFVLGIVGIYVGKAFEKIKGRPVYVVDEAMNDD